jgi:transposase
MRKLLKRTVQTAVRMDLVELALQAVDGTKVGANASGDRTLDAEGLQRLLRRLEDAVRDLEAQSEAGEDAAPVHLPQELAEKTALREQVRRAMEELSERGDLNHINLTDTDARLMKTRQGIAVCYNAQAMVSPTQTEAGKRGMLITAVEVTDDPDDHSQLAPMLQKAEETTGVRSEMTLADAGYHSGSNLKECALSRDQQLHLSSRTVAALHPYEAQTWDSGEALPGLRRRLPSVSGLWGVYEGWPKWASA